MEKSRLGTKISILLLAFCTGSLAVAVPAIDSISKLYPDVAQGTLLLIGTLPTLAAIPTSVFSAIVYKLVGYKRTGILAVLMVSLGGALPLFFNYFTVILVSRIVLGVGYGLCSVLPATLIGISLAGDKSQQNFYGYQVAMLGLAGAVFGQVGGIMTGIDVKWMWAVHLGFIAVLPVILFAMKEPTEAELEAQNSSENQEINDSMAAKAGRAIPLIFFGILIFHFLCGTVDMTWYANVSYIVSEKGIANGAVFSGTLIGINNLAMMIGGATCGRLSRYVKQYSIITAIAFVIAGCLLTWVTANKFLLILGSILVGYGDSFAYSSSFAIAGYLVPGKANGLAVGIMNAVVQGGCFFGPYIPLMISSAMGSGGVIMTQMIIIVVIAVVNATIYSVVLRTRACKPLAAGYAAANK